MTESDLVASAITSAILNFLDAPAYLLLSMVMIAGVGVVGLLVLASRAIADRPRPEFVSLQLWPPRFEVGYGPGSRVRRRRRRRRTQS